MDNKDKILDAIIVLSIAFVGLFAAYLTFGVLKSEAAGEFRGYQVGGAIAGALVSWSLLGSIYLKFRKSSDEPQRLNARINELQQKLLRGAPHPTGFNVEISEQQKIVLARPENWQRKGGLMFDFELVDRPANNGYPARFTCSYVPITPEYKKLGQDRFYEIFEQNIRGNEENLDPRCEYIYIGGDAQSTKCIKVIAGQYMRLEFYENSYGGKPRLEAFHISPEEYQKHKSAAGGSSIAAPAPVPEDEKIEGVGVSGRLPRTMAFAKVYHMFVACYREDLKNVFFFEFMDDEKHFAWSSGIFNQVLNSTRFLN